MSAEADRVQCPWCVAYVDKVSIVIACGVVDYMCAECFMKVDVDIIGECSV
jgi:hypothetical protein